MHINAVRKAHITELGCYLKPEPFRLAELELQPGTFGAGLLAWLWLASSLNTEEEEREEDDENWREKLNRNVQNYQHSCSTFVHTRAPTCSKS